MLRCPGRAKRCIMNPNHLQVLAVRAAALAQLGRTEEAAKAAEVLLSSYPEPDRRTASAGISAGKLRPTSPIIGTDF